MKRIILLALIFSVPLCAMEEPERKYALMSVSDKTGVTGLAQSLIRRGYHILASGGTFTHLQSQLPIDKEKIHPISDVTQFPEILGGRVKTLHPKIHGALLAKRSSPEHMAELQARGIPNIDVVVVNLYPFERVVQDPAVTRDAALENIDIGGVALLRAAAKNHDDVLVLSDPRDYVILEQTLHAGRQFSVEMRQQLALKAFKHTADYDGHIAHHFSGGDVTTRQYEVAQRLKYGLNPYQGRAAICAVNGKRIPLRVRNGTPGFINFLDALGSWQLVKEAKEALGFPACASFKHTSPAGAALGLPLSPELARAYHVANPESLSPVAAAFVRARNADPKSSFGDWIAVSDVVDEVTARLIKAEVSDGIIAPGYTDQALAILQSKKEGSYAVVEMDPAYTNDETAEFREIFGVAFRQEPNRVKITPTLLANIVTRKKELSPAVQRDLLLAMIALKYTQSNSVAYAKDGQVIGIGAGQQNRVDCVKLAGKKAATWALRQHPRVQALKFKKEVKRVDRTNAVERFIEGEYIDPLLEQDLEPLDGDDCCEFLSHFECSMASDAFFPFEDNIDAAAECGVRSIVQPGGSTRDQEIIDACDKHGVVMALSGTRLFTH